MTKQGSNLKDFIRQFQINTTLVSKKHIKCITVTELMEGKEISPTSHNYLGNRKEFDLDKNVIIDFCAFAIQFFESV